MFSVSEENFLAEFKICVSFSCPFDCNIVILNSNAKIFKISMKKTKKHTHLHVLIVLQNSEQLMY